MLQLAICFFGQNDALVNATAAMATCTSQIWPPSLDPFDQLDKCATEASAEAYDIFLQAKANTDNNYPLFDSCKNLGGSYFQQKKSNIFLLMIQFRQSQSTMCKVMARKLI